MTESSAREAGKAKETGMEKRLSVIIPCYRVERYLRRCLDSLLAQTLTGVEMVCVNDGSPDGCPAILREYADRYGDRIVVIDQENQGVWKARKRGIEAATGEYIGFLDPDDFVRPDYARRLYETAKAQDADIACCGFDRMDEETGKRYSREMTGFPREAFDLRQEPGLALEVNPALWNKIYRAELIRNMPEISWIPRVLDDLVFLELILLNARQIAFVPESLILYTVRRDSIISSLKPEDIPGVYTAMKELRAMTAREQPGLLTMLDAAAFLHLRISLMHRVSASGQAALKKALRENRIFLDAEFPGWRRNPYIRLSYVLSHRGANRKLYTAHVIYDLGLARPFLAVYGWMIDRLGVCIKW